jgi:ribonuclease P protein component
MKDVAKQISKFKRKEIDLLFKTSQAAYKSKELTILSAPCILSFGRILLITSRKVGNAPERNLLRRWGRAIFYEEKLFEKNKDHTVIFRSSAKSLTFAEFKEILKKAALFKPKTSTASDSISTQKIIPNSLEIQEK